MKKILHIVNELNVGGSETALYRQLLALQDQAYTFYVIVLSKPGYYSEPIKNLGIPIYYLAINKTNILKALYQLITLIKKIEPDIVQTWLYHSDFLGGLCAKFCGVKKIIWGIRCEGVQLKSTTKWVKRGCALLSWIVPNFIITNSQAALHQHSRTGYQSRKMQIIYNGFDTELFAPQPVRHPEHPVRHPERSEGTPTHDPVPESRRSLATLGMTYRISGMTCERVAAYLPENALLIGTLARFHQDKDYPNLIQAIDTVCALHDNVYFLFCGQDCDDNNLQLNSMLTTLTYRNRVILLGKTDNAASYLNQLNIFILSSQTESFPNCLGEAMACGLACIATDVGEARVLLGDTGLIVPPNDPTQLASACLTMLNKSENARTQNGVAARQRIKKHYSIAQHKQQIQALYES